MKTFLFGGMQITRKLEQSDGSFVEIQLKLEIIREKHDYVELLKDA